MLTIVN